MKRPITQVADLIRLAIKNQMIAYEKLRDADRALLEASKIAKAIDASTGKQDRARKRTTKKIRR